MDLCVVVEVFVFFMNASTVLYFTIPLEEFKDDFLDI